MAAAAGAISETKLTPEILKVKFLGLGGLVSVAESAKQVNLLLLPFKISRLSLIHI